MTQQVPYTPTPANQPGRVLSIVGFILAFVAPLVGLILSIIARTQSQAAGLPIGLAKPGIIVSIVMLVIYTAVGIALAIGGIALFTGLFAMCQELGPGVHHVDGVTYTCGS